MADQIAGVKLTDGTMADCRLIFDPAHQAQVLGYFRRTYGADRPYCIVQHADVQALYFRRTHRSEVETVRPSSRLQFTGGAL